MALLAFLSAMLLVGGGCYSTSTIYRPVDAEELHGRTVVMLESTRLAPFTEAGYERLIARVENTLATSGQVGSLIPRSRFSEQGAIPLATIGDYRNLSNTISLLGVVNPEAARRMGRALNAQLLASVHYSFLPCPDCEEGDQLWMVAQFVEAGTGRLVFREHLGTPVDTADEGPLLEVARDMTEKFLSDFEAIFALKWHKQRYNNLKPAS